MLILPIKKKWFDMILSGEKKEEYREIKPYWTKKIMNELGVFSDSEIEEIQKRMASRRRTKEIEAIFRNGYQKSSPALLTKVMVFIGYGNPEWGAEKGKLYYVLTMREILKGSGEIETD